jgi:isopenicillin N synthase-like dioxygenase
MHRVPVVDLSLASTQRGDFGDQVFEGMQREGFLGVVGHGLTAEELDQAREATIKLFTEFSWERLEERYGRPPHRQRGFSPLGTEQAVNAVVPDVKTFWMTRLEEWPRNHGDCPFGENVWPEEVPEFHDATYVVFEKCLEAGRLILAGLERAFNFPTGKLVNMTMASETVQRPIYYPPINDLELPPDAMRSAAHEDINLLSVLPAVEPGLGLRLGGVWREVEPDRTMMLVNIGEMIAEITGVYGLVPTTHRVRMPEGEDRKKPRVAFPLFVHARRSVELRPGLFAGDWLDERIRAITKR